MALQELLEVSKRGEKIGLSEERVRAVLPVVRQYVAFWREYPDMFVDFMQTGRNGKVPENGLKFYFYQRVFLRIAMRYKYVYATYPRGYSKSFLSILILMIRCILYPRCKLFVTSGGKEQSAGIIREKVTEICQLVPAFERELDRTPGRTREGKDYVCYVFKNGSFFDNVAANEKSRGKRKHGGVIEECVGVDGDVLSQVILPMMNVSRVAMDGSKHDEETLNKSQIFITTAGWKGSYAYDKLIQFLIWMIIDPNKAFIMGGTWRIPVVYELQDKTFIMDMKRDGTFNDASFAREYESEWSGTAEGAFFDGDAFDRNRILLQPEREVSGRSAAQAYYILGVDVGRKGCDTVVCVFKVTPQPIGDAIKSLVNIYTFENMHFEDQCIALKKLYYKYRVRRLVIDGNGLGIGLVDYLVKPQFNPNTDDQYPPFGVYNDDEGFYKQFKTPDMEQDALYILKANAPINTEAHTNAKVQIQAGKVKFLIEEKLAKAKLLGTVKGNNMTSEERADYLKPFTLTSILREELLNLREETEGLNIILKPANKSIKKDKVSALEYALYYIKQVEENSKRKRKFNVKDFMLMN